MPDDRRTPGSHGSGDERTPPGGWWRRCAALAGVAGLAVTQPVLDLFGRNPEFFVAGRYSSQQIIAFALIVAIVPAAVAVVGSSLVWLVNRRVAAVVLSGALGAFAGVFALVVLGSIGVDRSWVAFLVAVASAALTVWLERTHPWGRALLSYLALGNLAFLALFLFASPTAELVGGNASAGELGSIRLSDLQGPVVFVILDELPVTTLMRADGRVNEDRYPNFARLAATSTWFRNASSHSPMTSRSVPAMLTGTFPDDGELPTYRDHPRNYFSLFGSRYRVHRYESVTDMCPPDACEPLPQGSIRDALQDGAIAYGHRVLPGGWADRLPSIDHSWGNFGGGLDPASAEPATGDGSGSRGSGAPQGSTLTTVGPADDPYGRWRGLDPFDRSALGQFRALDESVSFIDDTPSVNLFHVALPHYPWTLTPWGTRLTRFPNQLAHDPDDPAYEVTLRLVYQLHSLQAGAADVAVGNLIDHLRNVGAWDDALVVITSDHGTSLLPPDLGRKLTSNSREELLRMPLFIKAPGQDEGEVRDDVAQTIDILPSIVDLLGVRTDWVFDGHSLFDGSKPSTDPDVDDSVEPALDIAARHGADFAGDDWAGLAGPGELGGLVGTGVDAVTTGQPSTMTWSADDRDLFASLPTSDGRVPYLLAGTMSTPDSGRRPPDLVVAVNGVVAGIVGATEPTGSGWRFLGLVGPFFADGANTVEAYEVEPTALGPVFHLVRAR
ncbi:MAG: sulfatase-like hydrolase/transferase [Acidimicrobiales bacterium]